jgi:hypothetical protein
VLFFALMLPVALLVLQMPADAPRTRREHDLPDGAV